jgi:hypothetical protein
MTASRVISEQLTERERVDNKNEIIELRFHLSGINSTGLNKLKLSPLGGFQSN